MYNYKLNILANLFLGEIFASSLHNFIDGLNLNCSQKHSLHQIVSAKSNFDRTNSIFQLLY